MPDKEAEKLWRFWYNYSEKHCTHGNACARRKRNEDCTYGMRIQKTELITGLAHLSTSSLGGPSLPELP